MSTTPDIQISTAIEEGYEAIGRSLVLAAIEQADTQPLGQAGGTSFETIVSLPLTVQWDDASSQGMLPRGNLCCACVKYANGDVACTGYCCTPPKLGATQHAAATWQVAPEIEDGYADLGRSVVAAAIRGSASRLGQPDDPAADQTIEASIHVTLTIQGGATQMRPQLCCICHEVEGVVECTGPCCPGH